MRAFIYARYSAGPKQKELSIEGQLRECHEFAEKLGYEIVGEYCDHHISGKTDNRAEFRRLMRDVEAHVVDTVIVWKLDRFFRNRAESALYRKHLSDNGVQLVSAREQVPPGSAGIITTGMLETLAEWYSAQLAENVKRGMLDTASNGLNTGPYPLGYKVGSDKHLHIDPPAAETVQMIFEMYRGGTSYTDIAARLNDEGRRNRFGKPFSKSSFNAILRNEKYIGIVRYAKDVELKGGCPRIIEDDLFFSVQRKLKINKHRPGSNKADVDYQLSGKLFCGLCGSPMAGIHGTSHTGVKHYYYSCLRHRMHTCDKRNVRKDGIEDAVLDATLSMLEGVNIPHIADQVEQHSAKNSESAALLKSLNAQLAEVETQIKNIGKAIMAGIITETTKEMLESAEADRAALKRQIDAAKVQASLTIKAEQIACWLDDFKHGDRRDPNFRRRVFGSLVNAVYVYDDYLKIVFNTDKQGAVEIPFSEISDVGKSKMKYQKSSHFKSDGPPKRANPNPIVEVFYLCGTFGLVVQRSSRW